MIPAIRGVEIHYYAVCKRKLWLFHKGIGFENDGEHERVMEGKILHERAYSRMNKDLAPEEYVRVDGQEGDVIREIKLTSRMQKADRLQMLYYLYVYKRNGLEKTGLISYTKEKKTVEVILDEKGEQEVKYALSQIPKITKGPVPPFRRLPYCVKCAYRDFCFSGEVEEDRP